MTIISHEEQPQVEALAAAPAAQEWVRPAVTRFAAGGAELGNDNVQDGFSTQS